MFIGNISVPQDYGVIPHSYILHNDGKGNFSNVTESVAPGLCNIGMVTSAAAADINGDGKKDLVVSGDWMYPRVFTFNGKQFTELKTGLEKYVWMVAVDCRF